MTKRVLLVGASGFIGRYCLGSLHEKDYQVCATSRNLSTISDNRAQWRVLDIFDKQAVDNVMAELKPTHMIDCAWFVKHGEFWESPMNLQYIEPTLHLYQQFSQQGGQRCVFLGTGAEIFSSQDGNGANTLYARTKLETAKRVVELREDGCAPYLWARLFGLYGMGEPKQKFIPYILNSYLNGHTPIIQNPNMAYDFIYAANLSRILSSYLSSDREGIVNCTTGDVMTLKDMAFYIHEHFFPDCAPPTILNADRAWDRFVPDDLCLPVNSLNLPILSLHDSLQDYISCLQEARDGMQKLS